MKPTLAGIAFGAVASLAPVMPIGTVCTSSWQELVYDTPSGKLEAGYYAAPLPKATSTPVYEARVVGTAQTARCEDKNDNVFITPITDEEYDKQSAEILERTVYVAPITALVNEIK